MRRFLLAFLGFALLVPTGSFGAVRPPEITDPAGDAVVTSALAGKAPQEVPWADLTSVRFTTTRNSRKAVTGFTVATTTVAAPAANQGAELSINWTVGDSCFGGLTIWRYGPGSTAPGSTVWYGCDGSDASSVVTDNFSESIHLAAKGSTITAAVPLAAFNQGLSRGVYRKGTKLSGTYATASIVAPLSFGADVVQVDDAPDNATAHSFNPMVGSYGREYVIGS